MSGKNETPRLFVNYRRGDSEVQAGRLFDELERVLAPRQVFYDREGIDGGEDWPTRLRDEVQACSVVLCLIGAEWHRIQNADSGLRRLDENGDWVRFELEAALGQDDRTIVPLLVDREGMPPREAFPESVRAIADLQAMRLRTGDWREDVTKLVNRLVELGLERRATPPPRFDPMDHQPGPLARLVRERCAAVERNAPEDELCALDERIRDAKRDKLRGPQPESGYVFGDRFEIVKKLGQGGFGAVWRAWDLDTRDLAAVKILHGQFSDNPERIARFRRGARRMRELRHPRIVSILEHEQQESGYEWFAMEHVSEGSLEDAVRARRLDRDALLVVFGDIASALDFAASKRIVHRDVKPANILIDANGRGKLTDFDLVKAPDTTQLTIAIGDYDFGAPEVWKQGGEVTAAADVYSFALSLLFALSGGDVVGRHGEDLATASSRANFNAAQYRACRRALAKDPAVRFKTCGAFWSALRETADRPRQAARAAAPALRRTNRSLVTIGAAVLLVAIAAPWMWDGKVGATPSAWPRVTPEIVRVTGCERVESALKSFRDLIEWEVGTYVAPTSETTEFTIDSAPDLFALLGPNGGPLEVMKLADGTTLIRIRPKNWKKFTPDEPARHWVGVRYLQSRNWAELATLIRAEQPLRFARDRQNDLGPDWYMNSEDVVAWAMTARTHSFTRLTFPDLTTSVRNGFYFASTEVTALGQDAIALMLSSHLRIVIGADLTFDVLTEDQDLRLYNAEGNPIRLELKPRPDGGAGYFVGSTSTGIGGGAAADSWTRIELGANIRPVDNRLEVQGRLVIVPNADDESREHATTWDFSMKVEAERLRIVPELHNFMNRELGVRNWRFGCIPRPR